MSGADNLQQTPQQQQQQQQHKYAHPWDDSDIILTIEGDQFHCHYFTLKMCSPVFRAMFSGNFCEERSKPVELPGKDKDIFVLFLDLIYLTDGLYPHVEKKDINKLLNYCDEYQVKSVRNHIDHLLYIGTYSQYKVTTAGTMAAVLDDLKMAENRGLNKTKDCIQKLVVKNFGTRSVDSVRFNQLSGEMKYSILLGALRKDPKLLAKSVCLHQIVRNCTNE